MELAGCVFLYGVHSAPLLHQRRPILRNSASAGVSHHHDSAHGRAHAGQRVAAARAHFLHAHLPRLVHNLRTPELPPVQPQRVHLRREQLLCHNLVGSVVLDTGDSHGYHVLQNLQGSCTAEKSSFADFKQHTAQQHPRASHESSQSPQSPHAAS